MNTDDIDGLVEKLATYNEAYRRGQPLVPDHTYDLLVEKLRKLSPSHPYLQQVEPEHFAVKHKVKHPHPMLSIQKAYSAEELRLYVDRVAKASVAMGIDEDLFRVTAKLDGVAGRFDGNHLVSRGDGLYGFDITSAFEKGVVPVSGRKSGLGEIVMKASYFDRYLSHAFEHPRNLVVGIIGSDTVNEKALQALKDGVVHFVRYEDLTGWHGPGTQLLNDIETIYDDILEDIDYPVDGIVIQVTHEKLKEYLGATAHHYRWQIAYKKRGETGISTVVGITWQVGRTGNITPVLEVEPVRISGATIKRVTAHHAGMVKKMGISPGARIEIIRSGEVIPKLEAILDQGGSVMLPSHCPSCGRQLSWRGDFLRCSNKDNCRDQIVARLHHWFNILGSADWFGIKTIEKLVDSGLDGLDKIYKATSEEFEAIGFGPVQSKNLVNAYQRSLTQPIEDWRLLAALGIASLGVGESRKVLGYFSLSSLWEYGWKQIAELKGFGEIKARAIMGGLGDVFETYCKVLSMGFELIPTPLIKSVQTEITTITGKGIVFTGKMVAGTRSEMQSLARRLGAKVQSSITQKTDYLVCGEKVGASKMDKAQRHGTTVITEDEFTALISGFIPEDGESLT